MEVVAADSSGSFLPIGQDWKQIVQRDAKGWPGIHAAILGEAFQEKWNTAHSFRRDFLYRIRSGNTVA